MPSVAVERRLAGIGYGSGGITHSLARATGGDLPSAISATDYRKKMCVWPIQITPRHPFSRSHFSSSS